MKKIRTRYAPSPTGFLHIGGARTALFAFLYAKHYQGDFIIRMEDTDIHRNVAGGEDSQIDNLAWLGIEADESPRKPKAKYGPYRQSEKLARYQQLIKKLLVNKEAYKAYDQPEELEKQRAEQKKQGKFSFRYDRNWLKISDQEKARREKEGLFTVRLALKPNKVYQWNDLVRGEIKVNTNDIGDWVIQKQDGYPTFNFANVVDDYDMAITHVLRGEEHTTNTARQLAIYDVFNWEPPIFGHLTVITNMQGIKLSKRDTSLKQFIEDYRNEGYLPEAIFNFLALLGWTHPQSKEKMTKEELITSFDTQRLSKSPSKFDIQKMNWFAKSYLKEKSNEYLSQFLDFKQDKNWQTVFLDTFKQSETTISDLQKALLNYESNEIKKLATNEVIKAFYQNLKLAAFTIENIEMAIKKTKETTKAKGKNLFMPIRQATTYQDHGPELAKAIFLVGKDLVLKRLEACS